eukprot:7997339-Alexandrium_andersonii.AAC.1
METTWWQWASRRHTSTPSKAQADGPSHPGDAPTRTSRLIRDACALGGDQNPEVPTQATLAMQ